MAVTGTPRIVTDGLVLYIDAANTKSYPGSGTVWTDLSPTQITGSLTNGPTFTTATGSAIRFDGSNDYVRISDNNTFNFTSFTIFAWFKSSIFPAFSQYRIINHQEAGQRAWGMQMGRGDYIGTGTSSDMLLFCHSSNGTTWRNLSSQTKLSENRWYHSAFTSDSTTMRLYLNGVLGNSTGSLGNQYSTIVGDIGIGVSAQDFNAFFWNGDIAMTSLYNRALSGSEILQNFEVTRERFGV